MSKDKEIASLRAQNSDNAQEVLAQAIASSVDSHHKMQGPKD